jgi:hypothetical protein
MCRKVENVFRCEECKQEFSEHMEVPCDVAEARAKKAGREPVFKDCPDGWNGSEVHVKAEASKCAKCTI